MILITTCILILVYTIIGKDIRPLLKQIKNVDWRGKINTLMDKLRPWALKAGRVATRCRCTNHRSNHFDVFERE